VLLGWLILAIWLYLLLGAGAFWRVKLRRELPAHAKRVVAVVPARDEADVIGAAIRSLLAQTSVDLHLILVDDNSSDGTAAVAREAASWIGADDRLTIISGSPLPGSWTGKLWAVQQGIDAALAFAPDFLLLTDADIEHAPENIASLVAISEASKYDLTSYMVKLHCATIPERLLIPAFVYFFFQLYPPKWIANPQSKVAGAAGGCMLIRPEALKRTGAMHSIRREIIDDCALARAVKRAGGRVWLGLTESARSIRPYGTFGEIERMIARSAFNQLRHSALLLIVAVLGLLLTYVVPVVLFFVPWWPLGTAAFVLMVVSYWPMVRFYRLSPFWVLTLPLAALFYMAATIDSAIRYWSGAGGHWKGRAQDQKA
jgi:hopene-associated glycosyltransferase HpnB